MKVLVVDDEAPARERLRQIVDDLDGYEFAGEAATGEQAIEMVDHDRPDIVLLDIRMPGLDGIETAHHFNTLEQPPAIVFTTAYDEYAVEAFDARAIGYVLKPVRRQRLEAALRQASRLAAATLQEIAAQPGIESKRQHVCVRTKGNLTLIPINRIHSFRADQKYVTVQHDDGECLIDESLKALEEEFSDEFVRIHRSALIAIERIERIEKTADGRSSVVLRGVTPSDDDVLIVSRRHLAQLRRRLKGA